MAFLGGLFDAFTGAPGKEAAAKNAALYQQYGTQGQNLLGQYGTQATDILGRYGTQAGGLYEDYLRQAQPLLQRTGAEAQQYLGSAEERARQALAGGIPGAEAAYGGAREAAQAGIDAYAPLSALGAKYGQGSTLYQDALGINGPAGIARAQAAFATSPGYQFNVGEQLKGLEASAAARGGALGGNVLTALQNRASGLAGQEYGDYLTRLGGFVSPELQATAGAAGGIAQGYRTLADIESQRAGLYPAVAGREAQLLADIGTRRAALAGDLGTREAGLLGDVAKARAGILGDVAGGQTGILGNVAQGNVNILGNVTGGQAAANTAAAQAAQNASQNFWNGLLNLGGAAIKGFAPGVK